MAKIGKKKEKQARAKIAELMEELRPEFERVEGLKSYQRERVRGAKKTAQALAKSWPEYAKEKAAELRGDVEKWANAKRHAEKCRQEWEQVRAEMQKLEEITQQEARAVWQFGEFAAAIIKKAEELEEVKETDSEEMGRLKLKQAEELEAQALQLLQYHKKEHRQEIKRAKTAQKIAQRLEKSAEFLKRWSAGEFDKFKA